MKMDIPLRPLAKAWQATQIAASDDEARPVLHRTALVEVFEDHGLRMVSTDSFVLVRAWVPFDLVATTSSPPSMRSRMGPSSSPTGTSAPSAC
jgi:hypothetical protein